MDRLEQLVRLGRKGLREQRVRPVRKVQPELREQPDLKAIRVHLVL